VVWTEHGADRNSARHFDEDVFNAALAARFPDRYGTVKRAGKVFSFPLGLVHAHDYIAPRMALVADAAHGIHPIAGQGLNLGFRDIAALAELVGDADDPGDPTLLKQYQRARRLDNMAMAGATDMLTRLFSNDIAPLGIARRIGLRAVARSRMAKLFFMKQAMGASGLLPAMIRDGEEAA
jgi:2-octaprenyl-6-methoxyphenol hydroxylase